MAFTYITQVEVITYSRMSDVTVPYHNKDLKPRTLASIITQASLTVEEFLDLV